MGDSKTAGDEWLDLLNGTLNRTSAYDWTIPSRNYGIVGETVATMKTYIDANLANESFTFQLVTINLGANDVAALPSEATWKANLISIIDSLRAKSPGVKIYIARVWRRSFATECDTLATWISDVVTLYSSGVYLGMDERIWLENGDDGATYTIDGIHYTTPAETVAAAQWRTAITGF